MIEHLKSGLSFSATLRKSHHFVWGVTMASARVAELLNSGSFADVARELDALELEQGVDRQWPWAAHVLGHLSNNDLQLARITHERAPESGKALDETKAALAMVTCAIARDFPGVHQAAASGAWSSSLQPLVTHVASTQKQRALDLMKRAYTTVEDEVASRNLGMNASDAVNELTNTHGWTLNNEKNMFTVKLPTPSLRQHDAMEALRRLTEHAVAMDAGSGAA